MLILFVRTVTAAEADEEAAAVALRLATVGAYWPDGFEKDIAMLVFTHSETFTSPQWVINNGK